MSPATPPKRSYEELQLHMSAASFLRKAWPDDLLFHHSPNGEFKTEEEVRKLLAMGMQPGVYDFQFILPNAQSGWAEAKDDDGVLSQAQLDFQDKMRALKAPCFVFRSIPQLKVICLKLLTPFGRELKAYAPYQPRYVSARFG